MSGIIESLEVLELELGDLRTQLHETDQRIKNLELENASLKSRIEEESKEIEALKTEIKFYSIGEPFGWTYYHRDPSDETIHSNDEWEAAEGYRRSRGDIIFNLRHEIKTPTKKTEELVNAVIGMAKRKSGKLSDAVSYSEIKRSLDLSEDQMKRLSSRLKECRELVVTRPKKGRGAKCYVRLA